MTTSNPPGFSTETEATRAARFHQALSPAARAQLGHTPNLALSAAHKTRMEFHRKTIFSVQAAP